MQLTKLPVIVAHMRESKYRIQHALRDLPNIRLRRIVDPQGETGSFLICTFNDAASAKAASELLRSEGIFTEPQGVTNIVMEDWGLHPYYNILSLVYRTSNDRSGFPWNLAENKDSTAHYERGTCPRADDLFARSLLLAIPSCLSSPGRNRHHHRVYQRFLPLNALSCRFLAMRGPCATLSPDSKRRARFRRESLAYPHH